MPANDLLKFINPQSIQTCNINSSNAKETSYRKLVPMTPCIFIALNILILNTRKIYFFIEFIYMKSLYNVQCIVQ